MPNDGDANGRDDDEDDYGPRNGMGHRPSNVKVDKFDPSQWDFEDWVLLFERAVRVATSSTNDAVLNNLFLDWLPLKLDWDALLTYKQAKSRTWPELKAELSNLFIDPQEEYKWQAKVTTIKWDGKESIHKLASRVVRSVNKYDRRLPQDVREEEYYSRFRSAFKKRIRHMIDMGCPRGSQTIENAKDVVMRNEIVQADGEDDETGGAKAQGNVSFANGNFQLERSSGKLHPDRATGIEMQLAGITTQLENIAIGMRKQDDRLRKQDDQLRKLDDYLRKQDDYLHKQDNRLRRMEKWMETEVWEKRERKRDRDRNQNHKGCRDRKDDRRDSPDSGDEEGSSNESSDPDN